jgi:uncharacterized protein YejL (UPF0352 family)
MVDIDVFQTVTSVSFEVEPNTNVININKVTTSGGNQDLQSVTDIGASTTNPITANSFVKSGGTGTNVLLDNGNTVALSSIGGATNLSPSQTATNFTINSDTGTDATIPLGNGTLAGATLNDYTTAEKTKLSGIATGAEVNVNADWNAVSGDSQILNKPTLTNFVPYTGATNDVDLGLNDITAEKLIKSGGTASQILAADGSVITAGNNITITGYQISSVGGAGGGGSSVNYYLNGGTSQGTFGNTTYYEFSKAAVIGTGADFNISSDGYIASFITDVADPSLLLIPAGNWNLEFFFSSSSAGGSPSFYVELYKYDGTTFTSIASNSANPEGITGGTAIDAYFTPLAVPETILTVNDRLAIRVYVNASSKTITLHTQNGHLCEVITTFTTGLTALNGLQAQVQNFATGTSGTDFAINSNGSTHTFNLPDASATARGVVTTASQTFAGAKTFSSNIAIPATGTALILSASSGGTVSGLTTTTYPDLTELSYVKGVTSAIQTQLNGKVSTNTAITGATKTKITYDSKGLVTNGADATTADIADSSNKRYVTDANLTVIGNTSGTNTGDNATNTQYSGLATSKQDTLQSTVNIKSINGNSLLGSGDLTVSASTPSQSAFTILANNTNASAVPTEQVFENITNATYDGATPTWSGTTAPSGAIQHTYSLSQVGNMVTLVINLSYATAGSNLTGVTFELPSTAPTPALPTSVSVALDVISYITGAITTSKASIITGTPSCSFRLKSTSPNVCEVSITRTAAAFRYAYATIQYFV